MKVSKTIPSQKDTIFFRNAILVGIAVICTGLYPLYKSYVFPKHSDLMTVQDELKNMNYHKGTKGGNHLTLALHNHHKIDFEISDLALHNLDNDYHELKNGDVVHIEILKSENLSTPLFPIKIYSLRTNHTIYLSLETHYEAARWNNFKFLMILIVSGIIIIVLAILYRVKKNNILNH